MNPRRRRFNRKDRKAKALQARLDEWPVFGRMSVQMTILHDHEVILCNLLTGEAFILQLDRVYIELQKVEFQG